MTDPMLVLSVLVAAAAAPQDPPPAGRHWAFVRPELPAVPDDDGGGWARNPIDRFVLARMREHGLAPSPEAEPGALLRRATLSLTGLPPTLAELDAFEADPSPDAYDRAVDRLLGSVAYAEHQTRRWLDLARYADTNGYEKDRSRSNWLWRDWVIDAFAADMPFDRFTIEQLAGDLLPNPTIEQRIATGFHRNSMLNDEGGIDAEEFRVVAVKDRVDATAKIWLGLTIDCAQCHDHKFDPISTVEYYRLYAFFDQTEDTGVGAAPIVQVPVEMRRPDHEALSEEIGSLERDLNRDDPALRAAADRWVERARADVRERGGRAPTLGPWHVLGPIALAQPRRAFARTFAPERAVRLDRRFSGQRFREQPDWGDGEVHELGEGPGVSFLYRTIDSPVRQVVGLSLGSDDGIEVRLNGDEVFSNDVVRAAAADQDQVAVTLRAGRNELLLKVINERGPSGFYFRLRRGAEPDDVLALLERAGRAYDAGERALLDRYYRTIAPELSGIRNALAERRARLASIPLVATMVMKERTNRRETRRLERGSFRQPAERVEPGVPAVLHAFPDGASADRLGLARWLVDPQNPLLGRVVMNRIWAEHFGRGLVTTPEDFGTRGDPPSHPLLLDWLARTFVDGGYSLSAMHRLIVTSATFRQSARASGDARARDPNDVWLARGPRNRLTFEGIRDAGLAISGRLVRKVGGPSVMPPQPPGVWENSFGFYDQQDRWVDAVDDGRYRRGIYVFLRRTAIYPTYQLLDGPSRELCVVRRSRTDTPLQALATLNDPAFVECAGGLARRALLEAGGSTGARVEHLMRLCTSRRPTLREVRELGGLARDARGRFEADPDAARALCVAARIGVEELDPRELAAWIVVANVALNLDETLTR